MLTIFRIRHWQQYIPLWAGFSTSSGVNVFGLEEKDLENLVKGIYIEPSEKSLEEAKNLRLETYDNWLNLTGSESKPTSSRDTEIVHSAKFGTIRLDNDNPPLHLIADEMNTDDLGDPSIQNELLTEEQQKSILTSQRHESRPQFEMPIVIMKDTGKNEVDQDDKENLHLETRQPKTSHKRIPSIYSIQSYNDVSHEDMWNILSKQIIFENQFLLAINKISGIPVHSPSQECRHVVIDFLKEFAKIANCQKIFPLHRLDKETTGVLLFAKSAKAAITIKEKFAAREISKKYLAITKNCPETNEGTIKIPVGEGEIQNSKVFRSTLKPDLRSYDIPYSDKGSKEAITNYKIIRSGQDCAFLELNPVTGIKHQIRVHLGLGIGCPILGDHKYSHRDKLAPQRLSPWCLKALKIDQSKVRHLPLHLHCSNIQFTMPEGFIENESHQIFVHARPPAYFLRTLRALKLR